MDSLYAEMRGFLENPPQREWSIPTTYAGVPFRSRLEAGWAQTLDYHGIKWEYEPELIKLPSGTSYLPDFRLPDLATVIEAKGPHGQRLEKTREYAREVHPQVMVLIGHPPNHRSLSPFRWDGFMRWEDALGYLALFAGCAECGQKQWCRPRLSLRCRKCGERFTGHLASGGEMRFTEWREESPGFGGALHAMGPVR